MGRKRINALQHRYRKTSGVASVRDEGHRRIEQVLAEHYGDAYEPPKEKPVINGGGDSGSPYRDLNNAALGNLDAWVPQLGIHRCKPQRGRFRSYVGVAQWR